MSSKHPVTTDTVTFGKGASGSLEETSDYSGSGEPTLVQWRRRPYERHTSLQSGSTTTDGAGVTGGVTNRCAIDLPPPSPTNPVGDLDFDAIPADTYQSLTDLSKQGGGSNYADLSRRRDEAMCHDFRRRSSAHARCFVYFLGFVALLAFLVACVGVGLASYGIFVKSPPQEDRITDLEMQLSASNKVIDHLTSMVEELRRNITDQVDTRNAQILQLEQQVNEINDSVVEILNVPTQATTTSAPEVPGLSANISGGCVYEVTETCRVTTTNVTPVDGSNAGSVPNYSSCNTADLSLTETDTYVQDVYCAITDARNERNPIMATLIHDEETNDVWCQCYVTALEARIGVVTCSLFVRRCPVIVPVE